MNEPDGATVCGLPRAALLRIAETLKVYCPLDQVRLFGSRAKGSFRAGSDIDLCLEVTELPSVARLQLEERLDDLLLPWKIDLVYWESIDNTALLDHIKRVGIPLSQLV